MIELEKGIPVPPQNLGHGLIYPWERMAVGDSFRLEFRVDGDRKVLLLRYRVMVQNSAFRYRKTHAGFTVCVRQDGDGIRVWRTG